MKKLREIYQEIEIITQERSSLIDTVLPPLIFVSINALVNLNYAIWSSLVFIVAFTIIRLLRGESLLYALGGLGVVIAAILAANWLGRAEGYFIPGILEGVTFTLACFISIIFKKPLISWISHFGRNWPRDWYWHPKVRPAYSGVTLIWMSFFFLRSFVRINLFQDGNIWLLGIFTVITGFPATIALLVISYLYGSWRLQNLGGPSVQEYKEGKDPPWESQLRGF
ncbi:MAG: DUF3159 domain-containing protein [Anaerolineales bacterium]|jgi:hypothetical protein